MSLVQEFLPLLIASGDARIVQISSLAGLMPVPFNRAYNASKAVLLSFGDTLRVELASFKYAFAIMAGLMSAYSVFPVMSATQCQGINVRSSTFYPTLCVII